MGLEEENRHFIFLYNCYWGRRRDHDEAKLCQCVKINYTKAGDCYVKALIMVYKEIHMWLSVSIISLYNQQNNIKENIFFKTSLVSVHLFDKIHIYTHFA